VGFSGAGVGWTDMEGNIRFVNGALINMFGEEHEEDIYGESVLDYYPDDQKEKLIKEIFPYVIKEGFWNGELTIVSKDGSALNTINNIFVINDKEGNPQYYANTCIDVTDQKKMEDEIVRSEKKYKRIFHNAPRLITLVYENGILKDCNARIKDMLGYNKNEVIGKNIGMFFPKSELKRVEDHLLTLINKGSIEEREYKMVKNGGEIIDVTIKSTTEEDPDGRIHTICFIADISERKEAEDQLLKTAEELKRSNEELEQFAYVSSHDMQEPLRVVSSYCQLLKEKYYQEMDEDGKKYLDYSIDSTFRMKTLIKDLLDFSRVGRKDLPFEKIDLNKLVATVLEDFEVSIKETKTKVIIESDMPNIFGIKFRIKQLLHNLVSNSIKFRSERSPVIRIGCCEESYTDNWLFYIRDNGVGIDSEYYERIFGIFKRLYSREEYDGTGIGLALCRRIAETHGGSIWVESEVNNGTTFYFTIPKSWQIVNSE
jgi:PAS domain S-box-containing protein